jgi:hypothetical protein
MTAHRSKPTITQERVAWFKSYLSEHPAWGVFHVALEDGNFDRGAAEHMMRPGTGGHFDGAFVPARYDLGRDEWPADLRDAAEWFDKLTASQRRRLGRKASQ